MARRSRLLHNLLIEGYAAKGKGMGRHEGKPVFVPYTAEGDIVNVRLDKEKSSWAEGKALSWETYSPLRVDPVCDYFGHCGGCAWQMLPYQEQIRIKEREARDTFSHPYKLKAEEELPIVGNANPYFYRNKMDFSFSNRAYHIGPLPSDEEREARSRENAGALGFHAPGRFDKAIPIRRCFLMEEEHNAIRNTIYDIALSRSLSFYDAYAHTGLLRNLQIRRGENEWLVWIIFGEEGKAEEKRSFMESLEKALPQVTSIHYSDNTKMNDSLHDATVSIYKGKSYIEERLCDLLFRIDAKSFFQTNTPQTLALYKTIEDFAQLDEEDILYDLYCGIGSIGLFLARRAKKVIGVEIIPEAIERARENSALNGIENCVWIQGEAEKAIDLNFVNLHGAPALVIIDPPRAGLHGDLIKKLIRMRAERIVYVSCNPATQARDIALLSECYVLKKTRAVDMFPQTHHIENVALLSLSPA